MRPLSFEPGWDLQRPVNDDRSSIARILLKELRELFAEGADLGTVAHQNVRIAGVEIGVVLVVVFGVVEAVEGHYLGNNRTGKDVCRFELRDVSLTESLLILI